MAEYIERKAILKRNIYGNANPITYRTYAEELIKSMPAADVVEVKHGKWIKDPYRSYWECSLCNGPAPVDCKKEKFYQSEFCPTCGAKMDG